MGQKVHPYGLRLGVVTDWKSRWYSDRGYAAQVLEDARIRDLLTGELTRGAVSRIEIERIGDKKVQIDIHTARPGVVIGRSGAEVDRLRHLLETLTGREVKLNVIEVKGPEIDAQLLAQGIADQLQGRVSFRRALKRAVQTAMKAGAQGVRVQCSGRLGGSDMGRREWYREGRVPLHTLRADVDFGTATARTTVGAIGVKVWVYRGDVMPSLSATREKIAAEAALATGGPAGRRAPAKARAEAAAGERRGGLIEAGGGKRLVEAGGGKRRTEGKRLIEAGGGKRVDPGSARSEFEEARREATETLEAVSVAEVAEAVPAAAEQAVAAAPAAAATALEVAVSAAPPEAIEETPAGAIEEAVTGAGDIPAAESLPSGATEAVPVEASQEEAAAEAVPVEASQEEAAAEAAPPEAVLPEAKPVRRARAPKAEAAVAEGEAKPVRRARAPKAEAAVAEGEAKPVRRARAPKAEAAVAEGEA
ncbi:MAG: 30S ribosomal protein S3, partial [Actinobacteria bacterium]|nr:30S ribosomal protein S3 [Actinomycetota bacterium]